MDDFYDRTDALIDAVIDVLVDRFGRFKSVVRLNTTDIAKAVDDLYNEFDSIARETYRGLAEAVYSDHFDGVVPVTAVNEEWVDEVLSAYDPVSKYIYSNELDRRKARLFEAVVASPTPEAEVDAAEKSAALMYTIYAVRVTDEAAVQAMKDSGVKRVRWAAEDDDHTCKVCHKRDDVIYSIDDVPPKPHINCRCWLVRVP